jgi:hypothetical protein
METIRACAEGEERFRFGVQNADFKNSPDVCPSSLRFIDSWTPTLDEYIPT